MVKRSSELALEQYNVLHKPDKTNTNNCLMGGTLIYAEDAYSIHEQIFNRDANANVNANENDDHDDQCLDFVFAIIHPPDQYGSTAINTSSNYDLENHCISRTLTRLLIHSSVVHSILVKEFRSNDNPYLGKMLRFVKHCVDKSKRIVPAKCFRNADQFEIETSDVLDRLNLVCNGSCESVVKVLTATSPDEMLSCFVSTSTELENLSDDYHHTVLLVHRKSGRIDHSNIPLQIGEHHLMAAFRTETFVNILLQMETQSFFLEGCRLWKGRIV